MIDLNSIKLYNSNNGKMNLKKNALFIKMQFQINKKNKDEMFRLEAESQQCLLCNRNRIRKQTRNWSRSIANARDSHHNKPLLAPK